MLDDDDDDDDGWAWTSRVWQPRRMLYPRCPWVGV